MATTTAKPLKLIHDEVTEVKELLTGFLSIYHHECVVILEAKVQLSTGTDVVVTFSTDEDDFEVSAA